jgi:hypothetical protein
MDTSGNGTVTFPELQDAFKAMKMEVSLQIQRNILKMFDQNGDNQVSLEEFERQMSKYLDAGKVEDPVQASLPQKPVRQELVQELKQEVKSKANFEDFGLKPSDLNEMKVKEQQVLQAIKKGELPQELICGEIKLQFDEGANLM